LANALPLNSDNAACSSAPVTNSRPITRRAKCSLSVQNTPAACCACWEWGWMRQEGHVGSRSLLMARCAHCLASGRGARTTGTACESKRHCTHTHTHTSLLYVGLPSGHASPHAATPPDDIFTSTDSMTASLPYLSEHSTCAQDNMLVIHRPDRGSVHCLVSVVRRASVGS
jgi:hypothetical protein